MQKFNHLSGVTLSHFGRESRLICESTNRSPRSMNYLKYLLFGLLLPALGIAKGDETPDSVATYDLEEVVVQASRVVRKADMDQYYPSAEAVENAKTGVQLLRNLMIPGLSVNDALSSISANGNDVQVRINGRVATIDQVKSLLPATIRRVEWMDNPGLRYGGATGVLNFIVANPTLGGSLMLNAQPALTTAFGYYGGNLKLNSGRSQWDLSLRYKLTNKLHAHRDYTETFRFPDGESLTRVETPLGGHVDGSGGNARLSYSYVRPDTTVLDISLYANRDFSSGTRNDGRLSLSSGVEDILLSSGDDLRGTTPGLSMYFEQHFAHNQVLAVDFGASLYVGHSSSMYLERDAESLTTITDVNTYIRDRNQAYALEADYIKHWGRSRLTAGASYNARRNRSVYENLGGSIFHQRQDQAYFFAEYFYNLGKVTLTGGLGAQYTSFLFRETGQGNHSWNLRPQFTATYTPSRTSSFRLNFTSWQSAPSLTETNITPQQTDGFQWTVGNPNLHTSTSYMLTLQYNYMFPRVAGNIGVRAFTSPDAITPTLGWSDGKLISSWENSEGLDNFSVWIAPQVTIIPEHLILSGQVTYRAERMRGTGYKLYNHDVSGMVALMGMYKGFSLTMQYQRAQRDLWGEKISWGEDISVIELAYNMKRWEFAAGMIMPFGKYDQGSKSLSPLNTNEQHMRLDMRVPYLRISYNLQWGRQKRGARKLVNAQSEADRSSAVSR